MSMRYSPTAAGWYNTAVHKEIPADAYEVPIALYNECVRDRTTGKILNFGADGMPYLSDPAPKTKAQLKREELQALAAAFSEGTKALDIAWLAAARADGVNEDTRKAAVIAEVSALQAQYDADVAAVRAKYA